MSLRNNCPKTYCMRIWNGAARLENFGDIFLCPEFVPKWFVNCFTRNLRTIPNPFSVTSDGLIPIVFISLPLLPQLPEHHHNCFLLANTAVSQLISFFLLLYLHPTPSPPWLIWGDKSCVFHQTKPWKTDVLSYGSKPNLNPSSMYPKHASSYYFDLDLYSGRGFALHHMYSHLPMWLEFCYACQYYSHTTPFLLSLAWYECLYLS